jgi:predicted DNA-binding transcriptional regulator AlpA
VSAEILRMPSHRIRRDREPWSTKTEVAADLHVSERWIELRMRHDRFPHHKDAHSRLVRFKMSEVDEWMASRRAR